MAQPIEKWAVNWSPKIDERLLSIARTIRPVNAAMRSGSTIIGPWVIKVSVSPSIEANVERWVFSFSPYKRKSRWSQSDAWMLGMIVSRIPDDRAHSERMIRNFHKHGKANSGYKWSFDVPLGELLRWRGLLESFAA